MKHYLIIYVATLIVMTALDMLWLGGIARSFYKDRLGDLMEIHLLPAILFYLMYVAGIIIFSHHGSNTGWQSTLLYGALFGFFAYATYDLTNLSTLRGWSLSLSIVDIGWGTVVTAIAATGGQLITDFFERS